MKLFYTSGNFTLTLKIMPLGFNFLFSFFTILIIGWAPVSTIIGNNNNNIICYSIQRGMCWLKQAARVAPRGDQIRTRNRHVVGGVRICRAASGYASPSSWALLAHRNIGSLYHTHCAF